MVLIGVVPESFAYGFIATVWTHNPWVGPAMIHFLFYGITAWAVHRCDVETMPEIQPRCETLLRDMLPYQVIPAWIGVFLGMAYVWAFDFPRLLSFQVFFDHPWRSSKLNGFTETAPNRTTGGGDVGTPHNAKPYFWTWLLVVAGMCAGVAIYFFELRFSENCIAEPEMTDAAQYTVAALLTTVAVIFVLVYIVSLIIAETSSSAVDASIRRLPDGHRHSAILNFKYMFFFGLAYSLPAIYDFTGPELAPWARWGLQIGLLAALLIIMFLAGANLSDSMTGDRYLGTIKASSLAAKLFVLWLLYSLVYMAAPLVDGSGVTFGGASSPEVRDSVIWVGILGGSLFVIMCVFGACYRYRESHDEQLQEREKRVAEYRSKNLEDDRALLTGTSKAGTVVDTESTVLDIVSGSSNELRRRKTASSSSVAALRSIVGASEPRVDSAAEAKKKLKALVLKQ